MKITVKADLAGFERKLAKDLGSDLPRAVRQALNWTAEDIDTNAPKWMRRVFDKPVRWTLNAAFVKYASTRNLQAEVYFKDRGATKSRPAGKYLLTQIRGGRRPHTGWEKKLIREGLMSPGEYAMPGKALNLDAYGNMPRGLYAKIIAQLRIGQDGIGNESAATKAKKKKSGATRYFASHGPDAPRVAGARRINLPRGIWQRDRSGKLSPVFVFVDRAPDYADVFHWKLWAGQTARARMPINFKRAADAIMRKPNR